MPKYYPDFSFYQCRDRQAGHVYNIGWLDNLHDYPKGEVSRAVLDKLILITEREKVNLVRGIRGCPICKPATTRDYDSWANAHYLINNKQVFLGHAEIWIPSIDGSKIFAALDLIIHYIDRHHYLPPQEYIDAVLDFDLDSDWSGEDIRDMMASHKIRWSVPPNWGTRRDKSLVRQNMMKYYPDFSFYQNNNKPARNVYNIGWLDELHDYPKGEVSRAVSEKLKLIVERQQQVAPVHEIHRCPICKLDAEEHAEIWIPGIDGSKIFAAHNLIVHYIDQHHYLPPQEYIDAVLDFDIDGEWLGENIREMIRRHEMEWMD